MEYNRVNDLKRQISYTETLKTRAKVKLEAKLTEYDLRIERIKTELAEAEASDN
jgi:hypothetical protein